MDLPVAPDGAGSAARIFSRIQSEDGINF